MKIYRIILVKRARKELQKLQWKDQKRIAEAIAALGIDPFRGKQLQGGLEGKWSVRVWPYRIVYTIVKKIVMVTVLRIGHRQGVYK